MTADTALSGRALDRALAEAMGWRYFPDPVGGMRSAHWQHRDGAWRDFVPPYSSSVDALISGPEARLRAAGWLQSVIFDARNGLPFGCQWWSPKDATRTIVTQAAESEAEARALAALAALALRVQVGDTAGWSESRRASAAQWTV